ncbi:MAG: glycoside hydrolase family 3 C-terminal domain-containing protein [Roseiflexaceae bacterium]
MDDHRIEALLDAMTLEEQVSLLAGASFWLTAPVERLGVPAIKVTDGPNGARGGGSSLVGGVPSACFPAGVSLASTWNTALVEQIGRALAEEARAKGARVLLAPTVNIHRSPLGGRNFECYSEDPHLTTRLGIAYINGVQSQGVGATIKHYVGNESEFERMTISSEIDERTLREIYLPPFEAAVKEAGVWAVMAAYNRVNGVYASEHTALINLLREEWGFDGLVMSDWFATHSTAEAVKAGLDLEMPGPPRERGTRLVEAVHAGEVSAEQVRACARRVLHLIARVGAFDDPAIPEEQALDRPEHRALIRQAAAEGVVLLKNDGMLPLDPAAVSRLAVIGPNARTAQIMGGGSAQVNAYYRVSPYDGLVAQVGESVELAYEPGCTNHKLQPLLRSSLLASDGGQRGFAVQYFSNRELADEPTVRAHLPEAEVMWLGQVAPGIDPLAFSARLTTRFTPDENGEHHFGLVSAGPSRLLLDGRLVVDNWQSWQAGDNYFGSANEEAIGVAELRAGQSYQLTVEYSTPNETTLGIRALRVGVARPLSAEAIEHAAVLAASAEAAIIYAGLTGEWDTEGRDRPHMDLVGRQNELIARVAAANPRTVVVLQTGSPVAMPWLDQVAAVVQAWYPGQECGNAISDVLFGAANPSGRLPTTFPVRLEDNPAFDNYPGTEGRVAYGEGVFVGYRHYDTRGITPLFPFGFGLSYTSFAYANLHLSASTIAPGEQLAVRIDITNTGARAGQEVVQLYVADVEASVPRPAKELRGFAKVALEPGETRTVTLTLAGRDLAFYDQGRHAWVAEAGAFEVLVGSSSTDIHARAGFTLSGDYVEPTSLLLG